MNQQETGYVSSDGRYITAWHGKIIGAVKRTRSVRLPRWSYVHGKHINHYEVMMADGRRMYGRSSPGIAVNLRCYRDQPSTVVASWLAGVA